MKIAYMNKAHDSVSNISSLELPTFHPIIDINISCKDLVKHDFGSELNLMCVFLIKENGQFAEQDRTEVIYDNPNPNFVKSFKTYYVFETHQPIRFEVYAVDSKNGSIKNQDFIGYCETDVYSIVTNLDQSLTFDLINISKKEMQGQVILTGQQARESNLKIQGQIQVNNLKKMKMFSKNNPFFEVSKPSESGRIIPVYRSEVQPKKSSCTFNEFTIPLHIIARNGMDDPITISVFDQNNGKPPILIGKYDGIIRNFMESVGTYFDLEGEKKGQNVGQFKFTKIEVIQVPTFADYLKSGIQLNMITAIDFTESNGYPPWVGSLHHVFACPDRLNQYEQSILSVGSVLSKYDSNQKFAVFGFGAKIKDKYCQCFPLTFDPNNVEVNGLQGILDAYHETLQKVKLWGPTEFAPIINVAKQIAERSFKESLTYTILLILTDGEICDMDQTIDEVVDASDTPLSIIIVGVGDACFDNMVKLDADENPLIDSKGNIMKRDIVQFVPFKKFKKADEERLEREVLEELPEQIHQYCSKHGFMPKMPLNNDWL